MKYNFDAVRERRNTGSLKWDVEENELPMWVADMDFEAAPAIIEALEKKTKQGIYGYAVVTKDWYQAIMNWWRTRHHFMIEKEWLIFCTGIVPAVSCAVKRLTNIGDNVLVQTPVYNCFFSSIEHHGRHVLENPLSYNGGEYSIDFEDLEAKLANPLTTLMILCNPQNPAGNIWKREELERIGELCKKYHVTVLSDEIHCDITQTGKEYTPFASISDICRDISVTCISATKTFNIAGLMTAAVVVPNERLRSIMVRGLNADEVAEPNVFAVDAAVAAFTKGGEWLDELRAYISNSKEKVRLYLEKEIPDISMVWSDATYLLWLDCSRIAEDTAELCRFIRKETGLYLIAGDTYRGNGRQFMRMNIACPQVVIEDGLERLKKGIETYKKQKAGKK